MKWSLAALATLAMASSTSAHYIFIKYDKNADYVYIRKNTNNNSPVTDLTSKDLRCNVGGASGDATDVFPIKAGDSYTFTSDQAVYHNGPVSVYLSKAPGKVQDYDGSGKWAKIMDWGPTFSGGSVTWPLRQTYTATLPKCIPPGEYLLRIQSLGIHNPGSPPQFYTSCAQLNVSGGVATSGWNPTLSIPGFISATDPGYTVNIYQPSFKSYTVPGGPVMAC